MVELKYQLDSDGVYMMCLEGSRYRNRRLGDKSRLL